MQNPWIKTGALALSALAIAACGGGGGGGGDDGGGGDGGGDGGGEPSAETRDQAAATASIANLFAKAGVAAANQVDEMDDEATTQSLTVKDAVSCGAGGTIDETTTTENVGSPFAENLSVMTTIADNCRESGSGDGVTFSSRQDGILAVGEAEGGAVSYLRASDINGDPASGGPFIIQASGNTPQGNFETDGAFQGELNVCDNCASPTQGGTQEIIGYLEASFSGGSLPGAGDIPDFTSTFGDGPDSPVTLIAKDMGATTETTIDGRFGFDDGGACDFMSTYETVDPLITDNETGVTESGRLNVTTGGATLDVRFLGGGSVSVNGETYTAEELAALNDNCKAALDQVGSGDGAS